VEGGGDDATTASARVRAHTHTQTRTHMHTEHRADGARANAVVPRRYRRCYRPRWACRCVAGPYRFRSGITRDSHCPCPRRMVVPSCKYVTLRCQYLASLDLLIARGHAGAASMQLACDHGSTMFSNARHVHYVLHNIIPIVQPMTTHRSGITRDSHCPHRMAFPSC
jgi:hypothetical protein